MILSVFLFFRLLFRLVLPLLVSCFYSYFPFNFNPCLSFLLCLSVYSFDFPSAYFSFPSLFASFCDSLSVRFLLWDASLWDSSLSLPFLEEAMMMIPSSLCIYCWKRKREREKDVSSSSDGRVTSGRQKFSFWFHSDSLFDWLLLLLCSLFLKREKNSSDQNNKQEPEAENKTKVRGKRESKEHHNDSRRVSISGADLRFVRQSYWFSSCLVFSPCVLDLLLLKKAASLHISFVFSSMPLTLSFSLHSSFPFLSPVSVSVSVSSSSRFVSRTNCSYPFSSDYMTSFSWDENDLLVLPLLCLCPSPVLPGVKISLFSWIRFRSDSFSLSLSLYFARVDTVSTLETRETWRLTSAVSVWS